MADEGSINYPYSTREVVNIVKHLQVRPTTHSFVNIFHRGSLTTDWAPWSGMSLTLTAIVRRWGFPTANMLIVMVSCLGARYLDRSAAQAW